MSIILPTKTQNRAPRCLIAISLVAAFLLAPAAHACLFWCEETPQQKSAREQMENQKRERAEFLETHNVRKMEQYEYTDDQLRADIAAGWDLILVVDRGADHKNGGQTLSIYQNGVLAGMWPISTAWDGFKSKRVRGVTITVRASTPLGRFVPQFQQARYRSNRWDEDMPFSIFFTPDRVAFHAAVSRSAQAAIGTRASAGCVRLLPDQAEQLFNLVKMNFQKTLIVVHEPATAMVR